MSYKYVFGPVMSGRLGLSLGLDLLGDRVCSMDCVYCEVGKTSNLTSERRPYVRAAEILDELENWKNEKHELPDVVTLGGLGEPTLNSEMSEVIRGVKKLFPSIPVAVLTNATTMTDPGVRRELAEVDVILPSMDSLVPSEFRAVNRPCAGTDPVEVAEALIEFRKEFKGKIFLEVLLAEGYNDSLQNLELMADFRKRLRPDRVDVVTLTRPGTLENSRPVKKEVMELWKKELDAAPKKERDCGSGEKAEKRSGTVSSQNNGGDADAYDRIQASLTRRPQTAAQLEQALGISNEEVREVLIRLKQGGNLMERSGSGDIFYSMKP
ncbi:radical SAM protein [Maridesulfovibrio bastinii]|uniref:radical SAM protein n=1 Tax=Maridesulfovibrio bastinii TaxID=47157 RepID=UPI000483320C|nr:radical SAM protein [Maridesulfovibrio bastinii]